MFPSLSSSPQQLIIGVKPGGWLPPFPDMPSTVIRSFAYHPVERRLEVRFVSGRRYSYFHVPPDLAERMRASFSKGEFFNAHVRGRYAFERIAVDA